MLNKAQDSCFRGSSTLPRLHQEQRRVLRLVLRPVSYFNDRTFTLGGNLKYRPERWFRFNGNHLIVFRIDIHSFKHRYKKFAASHSFGRSKSSFPAFSAASASGIPGESRSKIYCLDIQHLPADRQNMQY